MIGHITLSVGDNVAEVWLRRPEKLNALSVDMFRSINQIIGDLAEAEDVRVVLLAGEGRAFCAGLDLDAMATGGTGFDLERREYGIANAVQHAAWGWRSLPIPVIAAVHGVAFGAGLQIMSGADIRIGTADTRLSIREINWGLVPDMGGIALWRSLVRDDLVRELTYSGREFSGSEAERFGFLTRITDEPLETARSLACEIANRSPDAIAAAKRLFNLAGDATPGEILEQESREQVALKGSYNQREAVAAALERRRPVFK